MAKVLKGASIPSLYFAKVPLASKTTGKVELTDLPVILPHEFFDVWWVLNRSLP